MATCTLLPRKYCAPPVPSLPEAKALCIDSSSPPRLFHQPPSLTLLRPRSRKAKPARVPRALVPRPRDDRNRASRIASGRTAYLPRRPLARSVAAARLGPRALRRNLRQPLRRPASLLPRYLHLQPAPRLLSG